MSKQLRDEAQVFWLPDGKRLQMRHGPIDLVVEAHGNPEDVQRAYSNAAKAFRSVLSELVGELDLLRKPVGPHNPRPIGHVAANMERTTRFIAGDVFATPMIAVAGAVADHILKSMICDNNLSRAYVNNGGDIALYLSENESFDIGVCANPETGEIGSKVHLTKADGVSGIATSGWRGRSYSLGIADAVTVLAVDAASADVAATLLANAINLPQHGLITREKAENLSPDSDLGAAEVTIDVPQLPDEDIQIALDAGYKCAQSMIDRGDIISVFAKLQAGEFTISPNTALKSNFLPKVRQPFVTGVVHA